MTTEARYWIDDMYMIPIAQTQAFRATGETASTSTARRSAMVAYLDKLQKPNGLFHHGDDSAYYWGRGNGWVAAGMAELLQLELPQDHAGPGELILKGYRTDDGGPAGEPGRPWHVAPAARQAGVLAGDLGERHVHLRLRDRREERLARRRRVRSRPRSKAWIALAGYHRRRRPRSARSASAPTRATARQFYLDRPRATGDLHGQAPILWSATALLKKTRDFNDP